MSDNADDLLADDLGDHSLADYNLGNDEEDQLLADDYEGGVSQNVPPSVVPYYVEPTLIPHSEYAAAVEYIPQPEPYRSTEMECVVPNITVEVPNITVEVPNVPPPMRSYAPYEPAFETEQAVPPAMPALPMESPQIVPSEMNSLATNGGTRERFITERPLGAQRMPLHRDIPDTLDKVVIPGGFAARGRAHWRMTHVVNRHRMYKRQQLVRPNFGPRHQFPPPNIRHHFNQPPPNLVQRPEFSPPRQEMGPPRQDMGPPRQDMGPPRQDMGPPRQDMGPPRQDMGPPRQDMGPPRQDMGPPRQDMGPPRQDMGPPRQDMGPPRQDMGPPRQDMGPPRQDMGPPRQDMGPPRQEMAQNRQEHSPQQLEYNPLKPEMFPDRPDMVPNRPEMHLRPDHSQMRQNHEIGPEYRPEMGPMRPEMGHIRPDMPPMGPNGPHMRGLPPGFRPQMDRFPNYPPNHFQPNNPNRPVFPFQQRPPFRQFRPPMGPRMPEMGLRMPDMRHRMPEMGMRMPGMPEMGPGHPQMGPGHPQMGPGNPQMGPGNPQMGPGNPQMGPGQPPIQQEVRMLPVIPPAGLAGKKVLINPHFKGGFQQSVEGPIKDIDDAAERFIAEQRNALARAATRNQARRSPPRYIENTTIEIVNDLAHPKREEADLLRRQQQFIDDNRANLRRRMRSRSRSRSMSPLGAALGPGPARSRNENAHTDEEFEYRRRVREQASLRARVLRAKEVRRQRNAIQYTQEKERQKREDTARTQAALEREKPRRSPVRERSPIKTTPADSSIETLTPPRPKTPETSPMQEKVDKTIDRGDKSIDRVDKTIVKADKSIDRVDKTIVKVDKSIDRVDKFDKTIDRVDNSIDRVDKTIEKTEKPPEKIRKISDSKVSESKVSESKVFDRDLTPPLPVPAATEVKRAESKYSLDIDDDLDLILDDIDDILSDDDDSGRFKEKPKVVEPKPKPQSDLRSKLPPKPADTSRPPKQRIIFGDDKPEKKSRDKTPPLKKNLVSSSTNTENDENVQKKLSTSAFESTVLKSRQRIIFEGLEQKSKLERTQSQADKSSRRVVLQRAVTKPHKLEKSVFSRIDKEKPDPSKPNPGIFSRAVRTAIGAEKSRIVIKKIEEPKVEYQSDSSEDLLDDQSDGQVAVVENLPHGMTDMRLRTLAGSDIQTLTLDKEERTAKITFKTSNAAESFKKKFNNKMVAASRLSVIIT